MLKKLLTTILCFVTILSFTACSSNDTQTENTTESSETISTTNTTETEEEPVAEEDTDEEPIQVSVTFNAMKEFVSEVGGDKVVVSTIIPDGMEPHDFEPKAQDLVNLSKAQIFVYSGLGMEAWVDDAIQAADNANLIAVEASKGADIIENTEEEEIEEHGQYDPHIWLSLKGAQAQIVNIKDALVQADPNNKEYYEENCKEFVSKLEQLYSEYQEKFESVEKNSFVTGHAAFGYLCREFALEQNSVEDVFAEGEPSAQQLSELVEYCKENEVTTIFAEELASPEVSETLANEVGAKVQTIYTMESNEDDLTYLERMTENLSRIYESLK